MKKVTYFLVLFVIVSLAFIAGSGYGQRRTSIVGAGDNHKVLYYVDPMHPSYRSDKPGKAPDCGMDLEPVYANAQSLARNSEERDSKVAGNVQISAAKQQLYGVRVTAVDRAAGIETLRFVGRVMADEARVYKLSAGVEGFIQDVAASATGDRVSKNQVLGTFSAPGATMTLQTFLLNLGAEDRFKKSATQGSVEAQNLPATANNLQQRIAQLQDLGMSPTQIEEIRSTRQMPESIKIVSPVNGFVVARNVWLRQKFERGAEWFRIANLDRVWILADVHENETQYLRPGMRVLVTLPQQRRTVNARVSDALPSFDESSRTFKVRLEADNPDYVLRPDMVVDVEASLRFPRAIMIPGDALIDDGIHHTVFVEEEPGSFAPRTIETGRRFDHQVEVVAGLEAGERIVVSGAFLLNSEMRLRHSDDWASATQSQAKQSETTARPLRLSPSNELPTRPLYGGGRD
jgi:membrane fusion protein, copper/silver efflux system